MSGTPIALREVLPRDGFQDFERQIPFEVKVAIIELLWGAGLRWVEVSSMVHPRWVPQFSDAEQVMAALSERDDLRKAVFVPNLRGLQRALDAGADEVSLAIASTDSLSLENFAMSRERALVEIRAMATIAHQAGRDVTVTIGGAFGCPFEGAVASDKVMALLTKILTLPLQSVFLADTIGVAGPDDVRRLVTTTCDEAGDLPVGIHLHGGAGAVDGVLAAVGAGATIVDSALTGLGGCPFVPDAPGNVSTELTVAALAEAGYALAVNADTLGQAARQVTELLEEVSDERATASR